MARNEFFFFFFKDESGCDDRQCEEVRKKGEREKERERKDEG